MYRQFNIQQFYVLPHTAVFMCFVWISEQTAIISLYSINWLVFTTEGAVCLLRGTHWIFIYNPHLINCYPTLNQLHSFYTLPAPHSIRQPADLIPLSWLLLADRRSAVQGGQGPVVT